MISNVKAKFGRKQPSMLRGETVSVRKNLVCFEVEVIRLVKRDLGREVRLPFTPIRVDVDCRHKEELR